MTAPLVAPVADDTDDGDDLMHICCMCTPTIAFCGCTLGDGDGDGFPIEMDFGQDECVVCLDLHLLPCPRCGE